MTAPMTMAEIVERFHLTPAEVEQLAAFLRQARDAVIFQQDLMQAGLTSDEAHDVVQPWLSATLVRSDPDEH